MINKVNHTNISSGDGWSLMGRLGCVSYMMPLVLTAWNSISTINKTLFIILWMIRLGAFYNRSKCSVKEWWYWPWQSIHTYQSSINTLSLILSSNMCKKSSLSSSRCDRGYALEHKYFTKMNTKMNMKYEATNHTSTCETLLGNVNTAVKPRLIKTPKFMCIKRLGSSLSKSTSKFCSG